jgi:hypothetical protein
VSQPFDRSATAGRPGDLDEELKEFWVEDPFRINWENNLSSYERNRAFLNLEGKNFLEISFLTGADSDGDGRSVVAADLEGDGKLDLIVRQTGGGPLLIFENKIPAGNYLSVVLRGRESNKSGIGARLTARVGNRKIPRDLFPVNSYRSQAANCVHFGLGEADKVDQLTIRWPSGKTQVLENIEGNRRLIIEETSAPE